MLRWLRSRIAGDGPLIDAADYKHFLAARERILGEAIRQGELRLQAQLQTALASDARAVGLASLQAAASAGLIIAAAQDDISGFNEIVAFLTASLLLLGAMLAGLALSSVGFGFAGNRPGLWVDCIRTRDSAQVCAAATAAQLDKYLLQNEETMRKNGRLTNLSLVFLSLAPLSAMLLFIGNAFVRSF